MRRLIEQGLCVVTTVGALIACGSVQQDPPVRPGDRAGASGLSPDAGVAAHPHPNGEGAAGDGSLLPGKAHELHVEPPDSCVLGCTEPLRPLNQPVNEQEHAPPALSGGTLLATRDGKWLVAADPDRDRVYFIDVELAQLSHVRELAAGAEPGRVIEDDNGRIHVALRGRGALLSMDRAPDSEMTERTVCSQPRGVAYDAAQASVHVACADGKLVSLPAADSGEVTRRLELGRDLRDVLVLGDELWVTRFRSAELLRVGADGAVIQELRLPSALVRGQFDPDLGGMSADAEHTANVAWRAIDIPSKGSAILHQRSRTTEIKVTPNGYGSQNCSGPVQSSVTIGLDRERGASADLSDAVLAVDLAANPSGSLLAVVSPANWGSRPQLTLYSLTGTSVLNPRAPAQPLAENLWQRGVMRSQGWSTTSTVPKQVCVAPETRYPTPQGQVSSVTFVGSDTLALFEREPAAISLLDVASGRALTRIELEQASRYDTGHGLFHMRTPAGIACASCHAEAGDDGHVWLFAGIGSRRTQNLRGGILGSEPFHWDGEMKDFDELVANVFVQRMSVGEPLKAEQTSALLRWIDEQPLLAATPADPERVQRGKELFHDPAVACASCHAGPLFTDNRSVDVGTGAALQVPALRGVSFRLPVMHDGCAHSLEQRFDAACGGDRHGNTAQLSPAQLADLIAYLETI